MFKLSVLSTYGVSLHRVFKVELESLFVTSETALDETIFIRSRRVHFKQTWSVDDCLGASKQKKSKILLLVSQRFDY